MSPLADRLDYHGQLTAQLQIGGTENRVVYSASAGRLVAARVSDPLAIVEHKLYWGRAWSEGEALYLTAVMNAPITRERVAPLQSLGGFGPRDIDKAVFLLPIPEFDATDELHLNLVALARRAEQVAAAVEIPANARSRGARNLVMTALVANGVADDLSARAAKLFERHSAAV